MKFACEHCGRSYAVADELRGKTFKMKCRACGQVIVVKGAHPAEPAGKAGGAPGNPELTPSPLAIPGAHSGDEPLARPPAVPEVNPFVARPVSAANLGPHDADSHHGEAGGAALPPPPREQYIDLVIDEEKAGGGPAEAREPEAPPRPPPPRDGSGLQDPFADWKSLGETEKGPLEPVEPPPARPPPELGAGPAAPARARPEPWPEPAAPPLPAPVPEGLNPKVLAIAGGVAVAVVAVLLFVYVGRGGKSPGPSAPVTAQPAPVAAQPAPVAAPPAPAPAAPTAALAEPEAAPDEEQPKPRAEPGQRKAKPVKVAREERRPEPKIEPPRRAPQPAPEPPPVPAPPPRQAALTATPSASVAQPKATGQLTPQQIAKIVTANKRAFEQCIAEAGKRDPGLDLSGRQVTLMLTVNPNGKVAYPTIDDVELNKTDLGGCIKSAGRLMMFPSFEGEPMKVEVPLTLGR